MTYNEKKKHQNSVPAAHARDAHRRAAGDELDGVCG